MRCAFTARSGAPSMLYERSSTKRKREPTPSTPRKPTRALPIGSLARPPGGAPPPAALAPPEEAGAPAPGSLGWVRLSSRPLKGLGPSEGASDGEASTDGASIGVGVSASLNDSDSNG